MAALHPIDFSDLDTELHEALRPRVERLGYLGDFFGYMAHQPAALLRFDQFTEECKRALGPARAEIVALTAATRLGNHYERHQHERLALACGLSTEWVHSVEQLAPDSDSELDDAERAIQRFVLSSIDTLVPGGPAAGDSGTSHRDLGQIVEHTDEATAAAVAMLTARFVGHALVAKACLLEPPVPSIFATPDEERSW